MLRLRDPGLAQSTREGLTKYQCEVDSAGSYAEQVAAGGRLFSRYNREDNRVFGDVRKRLGEMCAGARRCGYCEDSMADQIDHIRPKDLYPERVFAWGNYLLACRPCNVAKSNRFSVVCGGGLTDVTRRRGAPVLPPLAGSPGALDPRREDPLDFLDLDIVDTFWFMPRETGGRIDRERAAYTIDTLKLNRDVLLEARRHTYGVCRALLRDYRQLCDDGASAAELARQRDAILTMAHPTVWREMQRQRGLVPELRKLFGSVPDAVHW